jgi:hypothetical protein
MRGFPYIAGFLPEFTLSKRRDRNDKVKDARIKRRGASTIFWIPDQVGNDREWLDSRLRGKDSGNAGRRGGIAEMTEI